MESSNINSHLIPNKIDIAKRGEKYSSNYKSPSEQSEFDEVFEQKRFPHKTTEIKMSAHASKRLSDRNIIFDRGEYLNIKNALGQLRDKGGRDSLVVTDKAAYILDVDQDTIVTAIDKNSLKGNVFTNLDSAIIMD